MLLRLKHFGRSKRVSKKNVDGLCNVESFHRALENERYRSDRSNHQYSLVVFELPFGEKITDAFQSAIRQIRTRIRTVDGIGWYDEKRLGIILPYTPREGAKKIAEEICNFIAPCIKGNVRVECEVFCYDPDGVARTKAP
jgi:PleD family two-component response regulator